MTEKPVESFDQFGKVFQTRVIQGALSDYKFFQSIYEIIKPEYFGSDVHRELWLKIKYFYEKYKSPPSTESLKVEFATAEDMFRESIHKILWEIDHKVGIKEVEQAKDKAFKFCSNKAMEAAIIDSVDLLKQNKFDEIQSRIEKALKDTTTIDLGHKYFESLGIRAKKNVRNPISSGFKVLDGDDILEGGFAGGELAVIMAPTGGGKSFFLVNFGVGALRSGVDVVHYSFELSEYQIGLRYDSCITGVETKQIKNNIKDVENKLNEFKGGKLIIKEFPTKQATVNTIKFHFEHLRSCGYNPGLIIIDYADLMRSRHGYEQKRFELESIYEDIRGLSMELKVPTATASQTNRGGFDGEVITVDKMGESIAKAQIADFIGTYSSSSSEKRRGLGKFFIAKNRMGKDGFWLPVSVDFSRAFISIGNKIEDDDYEVSDSDSTSSIIKELFYERKARKEEG